MSLERTKRMLDEESGKIQNQKLTMKTSANSDVTLLLPPKKRRAFLEYYNRETESTNHAPVILENQTASDMSFVELRTDIELFPGNIDDVPVQDDVCDGQTLIMPVENSESSDSPISLADVQALPINQSTNGHGLMLIPDVENITDNGVLANLQNHCNIPESHEDSVEEPHLLGQGEETARVSSCNKKNNLSSEEKQNRDRKKYAMRDRCKGHPDSAKYFHCQEFSEDERLEIWNSFWSQDYTSRRKTLFAHIKFNNINRRTGIDAVEDTENEENELDNPESEGHAFENTKSPGSKFKRYDSRVYFLDKGSRRVRVCQVFFLRTLGYVNSSVITAIADVAKRSPLGTEIKERRGGIKSTKHHTNQEILQEHIESFNPAQAHYRRLNAPNVRYLPRNLTIKVMLEDLKERFQDQKCEAETYRKKLKAMNISLNMPNSDECAECAVFDQKTNESTITDEEVEKHQQHKMKVESAKRLYQNDATRAKEPNEIIFSTDLQKILLLPMIPGSKECFFTSRLVVFNETFAPITPKKGATDKVAYCVMWHEAVDGRKADAITSSFNRILEAESDKEEFTFYLDNCSAQNKNWCIYSALILMVNSVELSHVKKVTFRYLTKGHTHMSADGVHGNIEKKLKKERDIYDYEQLLDVIRSSRKNLVVKDQKVENFREWKNLKVSKKLDLKLLEVVEAVFQRGKREVFIKTSFEMEGQEIDFLRKKVDINSLPIRKSNARGIMTKKKQTIIKNLGDKMPEFRKMFWINLPESSTSEDLLKSHAAEAI